MKLVGVCGVATAVLLVVSGCGGSGHNDAWKYGYSVGKDPNAPCHTLGQNLVVMRVISLDDLDDFLAGCAAGSRGASP
jgi:hypothetical protein